MFVDDFLSFTEQAAPRRNRGNLGRLSASRRRSEKIMVEEVTFSYRAGRRGRAGGGQRFGQDHAGQVLAGLDLRGCWDGGESPGLGEQSQQRDRVGPGQRRD